MAPFLAVYLFLVSVGIPLQRVYCACVGQESVHFPDLFAGSRTDQYAACQLQPTRTVAQAGSACCPPTAQKRASVAECCGGHADADANAEEKEGASPAKCLTSDLFFVQFGACFLVPDQEPLPDQVTGAFSPALASVYAAPLPGFSTATIRWTARVPDPPPGLKGADIRILYHSFLC